MQLCLRVKHFGAQVVHDNTLHTCELYKSDNAILSVFSVCPACT